MYTMVNVNIVMAVMVLIRFVWRWNYYTKMRHAVKGCRTY